MPKYDGIHVDFDLGAHIAIPYGHSPIKYFIYDEGTGNLEDSGDLEAPSKPRQYNHISTSRKYFVNWRVDMISNGRLYRHVCDPTGKDVVITIGSKALGDSIAWMPSVEMFRLKWQCRLTVIMTKANIVLFEKAYPDIRFLAREEIEETPECYAHYLLGVGWQSGSVNWTNIPSVKNNLQCMADVILNVDAKGAIPLIQRDFVKRPDEPYVCIATRASRPCKEWQRENGWYDLTDKLKSMGYRVLCIDGDNKNCPANAEDWTGFHPLTERADLLSRAEFFIGLPSGLSWMAWAVCVPVVMIVGFTDVVRPEAKERRYVEFDTPYRVMPPEGKCRGCWDDCGLRESKVYDDGCFRKKSYECTKSITVDMVMKQVKRILTNRID